MGAISYSAEDRSGYYIYITPNSNPQMHSCGKAASTSTSYLWQGFARGTVLRRREGPHALKGQSQVVISFTTTGLFWLVT